MGQGFGNGAPGAAQSQNGMGQNGANGGLGGPGNLGLGAAGQAVHGEYVVQLEDGTRLMASRVFSERIARFIV